MQQDAQTHRANAYAKNIGIGWLNLQISADLTIHLRLVLSFSACTFISGLVFWSRRVELSDCCGRFQCSDASTIGRWQHRTPSDTGEAATPGLRATHCKTQAPLDVYTALHQARDHATELNCRAMTRPPSVLDLPPELLKRVVGMISNITNLKTRTQVSLVSKAFAAAVKEQHELVASGAFLTDQGRQFMLATLKQVPTAFVHVTQLTLKDIERHNCAWSCALVSQSSLLKILTIQLTPGLDDFPSDVAACEIYQFLLRQCGPRSDVLQSLQQVSITKDDSIMLHMVSPQGPLFQHDKLACITAGRLPVLRDITDSSPELRGLGCNIQPDSAARDADMLSRLPGLDSLEIGNRFLNAVFKGTVRGRLTAETADAFCQATISHVVGPCNRQDWLDLIQPITSITSWCSFMVRPTLVTPARMVRVAPNLAILNIKLSSDVVGSSYDVCLTPKMVSVDVRSVIPRGVLCVSGIPSASLIHLCIQSHTLQVNKDLYEWVDGRKQQAYQAENVWRSRLFTVV